MSAPENVQAPTEPFDALLGACPPEGAAAYIEQLLEAALMAWRQHRDARGALHFLGQAVTLIARRGDL